MSRLLFPLLLLCNGCAFVMNVDGGANLAFDVKPTPEEPTMTPEALVAMHTAAAFEGVGIGMSARTRLGQRGFEVGGGPEVCVMPPVDRVQPYLCTGMSLLTLGYRDEAFSLGAMSPYVQPALAINVRKGSPNALFVSLPVGYDVRVTEQSSSFFMGLALGFGWAVKVQP